MPTVIEKYAPFIEVIFENIQQINDIKTWTIYIADKKFEVGM
jgi:exonuclease V gamma subunit